MALEVEPLVLRPSDSAWRQELQLPPPRPIEVILLDIDGIPSTDENADPPSREARREVRERENARQVRRINLTSELEEAGYVGDRLVPLLKQKVQAAARVVMHEYAGMNEALGILWDVRAAHQSKPVGALAQLRTWGSVIVVMRHTGMHVAERDLETIAAAELQAAKDPAILDPKDAGGTLLSAINNQSLEIRKRWYDWGEANLPPSSVLAATARREKAFDKPIRLQGTGFDGAAIDTKEWLGSVVLVDFWGSWCGPCKAQMPAIKGLREKYGAQGLRVVGIVVDKPSKAKKYLSEAGYDWPQIVDPDAEASTESIPDHFIATQYGVNGFPTLLLIDRQGMLRRAPNDEAKLDAAIQELLAK